MPPTIVDDPGTVKRWVDEKQALEVELAWEMADVFNDNASLRQPIRQRAHAAAGEMLQAYHATDALRLAVGCAWNDEHGPLNRLLTQYPTPAALHGATLGMNVEDCGQVIRLYGTFVEMAAKNAGGDLYLWLAERKLKRRQGFQFKAGRDDQVVANVASVAQQDPAGTVEGFAPNVMDRSRVETNDPAAWQSNWAVDAMSPSHQFVNAQEGGIARFRLCKRDTIKKIDRAFGLMAGASISGTTTDLMFFMDTFRVGEWDPIYYLLAIAGIVKEGHHTIVETAVPMTMDGAIDYRIGLYTTLMPTADCNTATSHDAQGAVWHVLDLAEQDRRNRLMLVYYDETTGWYEGCYLFDHNDPRFRLMATADENLLGRFERLGHAFPTHDDIHGFMADYGYWGA